MEGSQRKPPANPNMSRTSRRELLCQLSRVSVGLSLTNFHTISALGEATNQRAGRPGQTPTVFPPIPSPISPQGDQFLDAIEQANFLFFWEQANPQTGLIKDRCNVRVNDTSLAASIAST